MEMEQVPLPTLTPPLMTYWVGSWTISPPLHPLLPHLTSSIRLVRMVSMISLPLQYHRPLWELLVLRSPRHSHPSRNRVVSLTMHPVHFNPVPIYWVPVLPGTFHVM
uniref:Uncharacterized protein n=1 Tax=Cacopsylla melanoneura TaxID=428564 RepID=A0A8D8RKR2_9HEMI